MFDLKNAKLLPSPSAPPVFEENEERSYTKTFGNKDGAAVQFHKRFRLIKSAIQ